MKTIYSIEGMTCGNCAAKIRQAISLTQNIQSVKVNLDTEEMVIVSDKPIELSMLNIAVSSVGKYIILPQKPKNWWKIFIKKVKKFLPLIIFFSIILTWSTLHQYFTEHSLQGWMLDFMGSFFIIFGGLKVINWKKFVGGFREYDPLASRSKVYAYAYPAIEVFLGLAYQLRFPQELLLNIVTVVILSITTFGIVQKLSKGEFVQCACLGGFFNIPISLFTIFENVIMIVMAIAMQIMIYMW
ncbi:MAG: MauE/DoxX family redox-associated membrane protein [Minisyncoccia bacterium]